MDRRKAVFLDRDGVLNELAFNPVNGEFESPHFLETLSIFEEALRATKLLLPQFSLFVVSNQPSFAKGKTTLENIQAIAAEVSKSFEKFDIPVVEYFYCYHHPQSLVSELRIKCACRKPGTFFLESAAEKYGIDLKKSWMVGDQDSDVECGSAAGCRTVLVENIRSQHKRKSANPEARVQDLTQAINYILQVES